jgi:hypothetical protein
MVVRCEVISSPNSSCTKLSKPSIKPVFFNQIMLSETSGVTRRAGKQLVEGSPENQCASLTGYSFPPYKGSAYKYQTPVI